MHGWEYILYSDITLLGYDANGNCKGTVSRSAPAASKLRWELPNAAVDMLKTSLKNVRVQIDDLDLWIMPFEIFGKGAIKACGISPDAFVQMALQLAYKRDAGRFRLTYEASMTRLFREGRTETVRPCSVEAAKWALAMDAEEKPTKGELRELLASACGKHQKLYQDAMTGKGVDRHLFCLYVVSKYLEVDSPFLKVSFIKLDRVKYCSTSHTSSVTIMVSLGVQSMQYA